MKSQHRSVAPLSVCLIVRNEAAGLEECLASIRPHVAEICVLDTGSTDGTPKIAKKFSDRYAQFLGCNDALGRIRSFALARNRVHAMAHKPWVMWLDGDDIVRNAARLPELLAGIEKSLPIPAPPCRVQMPYVISVGIEPDGSDGWTNDRERIVSHKDSFEWRGAVHETLCPKDGVRFVERRIAGPEKPEEGCWIEHRPKPEKKREDNRNLRILETELAEKGYLEPREMYYLGRTYLEVMDVSRAIFWTRRYVEVSRFSEEKCLALVSLSEMLLMRLDHEEAALAALRAHATCVGMGAPLVQLAKCFYMMGNRGEDVTENFRRCRYFAEAAIATGEGEHRLFHNPLLLKIDVHRYLNIARYHLGDLDGALGSVDAALAYAKNDVQLLLNRALYLERKGDRSSAAAVLDRLVELCPEEESYRTRRDELRVATAISATKTIETLDTIETANKASEHDAASITLNNSDTSPSDSP